MKKLKLIKYDECYLYATEETIEFNASGIELGAMLSGMVSSLYNAGHLTKEEINKAVEFGILDEEEAIDKITEEINKMLNNKPKKKAHPKKTTKKEGKKDVRTR